MDIRDPIIEKQADSRVLAEEIALKHQRDTDHYADQEDVCVGCPSFGSEYCDQSCEEGKQ